MVGTCYCGLLGLKGERAGTLRLDGCFSLFCEAVGSFVSLRALVPLYPLQVGLQLLVQDLGGVNQLFVYLGFPFTQDNIDSPLTIGIYAKSGGWLFLGVEHCLHDGG